MVANGADIEILDTSSTGDPGVILPNVIRINGQEVLLPDDANIELGQLDHKHCTTIRLTMFVRSLAIKHEDPA